MATFPCPIPGYDAVGEDERPIYYVTIPDEWLGVHSEVFWDTKQSLTEAGAKISPVYQNFVYALALADDYRLPLLEGKPEKWRSDVFPKFPLEVMAWVNEVVVASYSACFDVKKNWLMPLSDGSKRAITANPFGNLAMMESVPPIH